MSLVSGPRPGRVTHCCFEHAGQNFGSLNRCPQGNPLWKVCGLGWRTSEVKNKPDEIPDDEHELVIGRVCAVDVAKTSGKVCVRLPHPGGPADGRAGCGTVAATTGAVERTRRRPDRAGNREGDRRIDVGLLADLVLPAGGRGAGGAAGQRPRREECAGPGQDGLVDRTTAGILGRVRAGRGSAG